MVIFSRSGAGAVELAALEMPCTRKGTVGSNPTRSAVLRSAGLPAQAGYGWQAVLCGRSFGRQATPKLLPFFAFSEGRG